MWQSLVYSDVYNIKNTRDVHTRDVNMFIQKHM